VGRFHKIIYTQRNQQPAHKGRFFYAQSRGKRKITMNTTAPQINLKLWQEFQHTGLIVIPNAFSGHLARSALDERLDTSLYQKPRSFAAQQAQVTNLRANDAPKGTALEHIIARVKQIGENLELDFAPRERSSHLIQTLELAAQTKHLYDLGGTSIAAVAGLQGILRLGGGWLDSVTEIEPGTVVIARSHYLLPYRLAAGRDENATSLIVSGDEFFDTPA
jgi:hypothetical protein